MTDHPFATMADIVKRATGMHGAVAADLSLFGGVLRCEACGGERPLDDIAGYLRDGWPSHCGRRMTWVTLRALAYESWGDVPDGFELVAVPDEEWRIETGRPCRRAGAGSKVCGMPPVASFNRRRLVRATDYRAERRVDSWWSYCIDHLYSRWVENGTVMVWVLRETGNPVAEPREDDELWRCWVRSCSTGRRSLSRIPASRGRRPRRCRSSGRTSR